MKELVIFGLALPEVVLVVIELLKKVGIVNNGDQARLANIILSGLGSLVVALIAEFEVALPQFVIVMIAALFSVVVSALEYNGGEKVAKKIAKRSAKKK